MPPITDMSKSKSHSIHLEHNTIAINEDDALLPEGGDSSTKKIRRCVSVPETLYDIRSVMKVRTLDESIHSTYGSESGTKGGIQFKSVGIREYARTVGDNPSCSSGPPVR